MIRAMLLRESLYAPRIFAHPYPIRFIHQPFRRRLIVARWYNLFVSRRAPLAPRGGIWYNTHEPLDGVITDR